MNAHGQHAVMIAGTGLSCALGDTPADAVDQLADGVDPVQVPMGTDGEHQCPLMAWRQHCPGQADGEAESERLNRMIDNAVAQAIAPLRDQGIDLSDTAILVGSTSKDIGVTEAAYRADLAAGRLDAPPRYDSRHAGVLLSQLGYGTLASRIANRFRLDGLHWTFNTACASSANAMLYATRLIQAGVIRRALVVGIEFGNLLSLEGFSSLMLISPTTMRPFDRDRDGVVLGEGTGAMLLGRADELDPAPGYEGMRLLGGSTRGDSSSVTTSSQPGIRAVMCEALANAGLAPGDIGAIKVHGTSTPANDLVEGRALREVFGAGLPPFTTLKSAVGHTLGACGPIETILFFESLRRGWIPATSGFRKLDEDIGIAPLDRDLADPGGAIMLNFFGFGGSNTTLLVSREGVR